MCQLIRKNLKPGGKFIGMTQAHTTKSKYLQFFSIWNF
jgi:hypothetical protein